jgi:zinc protease
MQDLMIDWKKGPGYKTIDKILLPAADIFYLENGIKVVQIPNTDHDIFRLDLLYKGGRFLEKKKLAVKFMFSLMREGTTTSTSSEIAECIDFYGASLRVTSNLDFSLISLMGLSKFQKELVYKLKEIIEDPIFPEHELTLFTSNSIERLYNDLSKNEMVSYREITAALFGVEHPYGYNSTEKLMRDINREDLLQHHDLCMGSTNCTILAAGNLDNGFNKLIEECFGKNMKEVVLNELPSQFPVLKGYRQLEIESKNSLQSSIKIGRRLFNRHHDDFTSFFILNTILGGYFGSRLMTEIREEQGLTYNINSIYDTLMLSGYFYIETEVATDTTEKTIEEIYRQLTLLQEKPVAKKELTMVQNYLMGNFLNLVDGPLNTLSFYRSMEIDGTTPNDFYALTDGIRSIKAKELQVIAQKYFDKNDMIEVIVRSKANI